MDNTSVFVIYKDGKRLNKHSKGVKVHVAYLNASMARATVFNLITNYLKYDLNISEYGEKERWKEEEEKEKSRYEVKEFIPKED